jgi:uncharacterized protein YbbC (DUF1343 family)
MILFGIDHLLQQPEQIKNQRIALVTNNAARTRNGISSRLALIKNGFNLICLFSPEHGIEATGEDGKPMPNGTDALTQLPIISLYGNTLKPSAKDLENIDLVLFDIPDIGSRFYTYLWTLTYVMEACAASNKKLIVLDRPNPISANLSLAEGPMLDEDSASFIGRWPIPIRHSCSLGELAQYFNATQQLKCNLTIIPFSFCERTDFQPDWGNAFVATSPAIQSFESMLLYPGMCLLEATNISEGRGTNQAFCIAGTPWMDNKKVAGLFNQLGLDEVDATPIHFTPIAGKYKDQQCNGIQLTIKEPTYFQSVTSGLLLIQLIKALHPTKFEWAPYCTQVNPDGKNHLDKLLGIPNSEALFDLPLNQFIASITKLTAVNNWKNEVAPYLIY